MKRKAKSKTGAYLRKGVLVETRAPEPDTPAAMYWELHRFPYDGMQPRTRDARITAIIAEIYAAKSLARRDYLFDQIIGEWERPVQAPEPEPRRGMPLPLPRL